MCTFLEESDIPVFHQTLKAVRPQKVIHSFYKCHCAQPQLQVSGGLHIDYNTP